MTVALGSRSPEFNLVAACCAWPPSESRIEAVHEAASGSLDWKRFLRIVERHRVVGLVHHYLSLCEIGPPENVAGAIAARAIAQSRDNLMMAAEAIGIQQLFTEAGIPLLFLKGTSLCVLAYGNIGIRHSKDIDVLVAPDDAGMAAALLERAGYRRFQPSPEIDNATLESLRPIRKNASFMKDRSGFEIELHWRLVDNPHMLGQVSISSSPRAVRLNDRTNITTLGEDDLFAYLCVHGAYDGWFRLKWLADVGALLAAGPADGAERLYGAAEARGAGPAAAQALLLCHRLLGTALPDNLVAGLRANARARWLERIGLWAMTTGNEEIALPEVPYAGTRIMFSHYLLGTSWRYRLTEFRIQFTNIRDIAMVPLPRWLMFLYPLLRVPLWVYRRLRGQPH